MRFLSLAIARPQRRRLPAIVLLISAAGFLLGPLRVDAANVDIWISADDRFDLYAGTSSTTTSYIGGFAGWSVPNNYNVTVPFGDYLYAPVADIGAAVWGLGGYLSFNGGATYTPILPGSGWEVSQIGYGLPWPSQSTVDSWITTANTNNDWVPVVSGSAFPGFGLPTSYGSVTRPALGSIWDPRSVSSAFATVLFRRHVVPEPASIVVLVIALAITVGFRRKKSQ